MTGKNRPLPIGITVDILRAERIDPSVDDFFFYASKSDADIAARGERRYLTAVISASVANWRFR